MRPYELVHSPVEAPFVEIIHEAEETLFISTPYIKDYGVEVVMHNAQVKSLMVLTNLDLANVTSSGFDVEALIKLCSKFDCRVSSLGKLHAKTYIADNRVAFITSANLTRGGLRENYEYGIILRDEALIKSIFSNVSISVLYLKFSLF